MGLVLSLVSVLCAKQNELQEEQTQYPAHQQRPQQQPQQHAYHSHIDSNQVNQHNPQYTALRASARDEGDKMAHCFQLSHEAYARGDGAAAKQLSNDGKQHQKEMERLNKEASEWIFKENNTDSQAGEIDLHGLYVKEAIHFTDIALQDAKRRGDSQVRLIVGKGLHSQGGVVKIKPAIEELMIKHQLVAELDPDNAGVLVVQINASEQQRGVDSEEIARRLEKKDESCTIM